MNPFNLIKSFEQINEMWSPKVIAELNDQYIKIAKIKGDFVWHDHADEDEMFYIVKGTLTLHMDKEDIVLKEGDGYVVPKATMHKPFAAEECWIMLIEPKSTLHTGKVKSLLTRQIKDQIQ